MAQDTKLNAHDIIWNFAVTDPRLHTKGFTVYKVSCKSFPIKTPDTLTEVVCWKRYNDFKTLYKSLMALHKAEHRGDQFPEFVKPRLFGRFAESVIEKRRLSAADLLNFISTQPHLYKSSIFKQFLEEGRVQSDFNKRGAFMASRSSHFNIISSELKVDVSSKLDVVPVCPNVDDHGELKLDENMSPVGKLKHESEGQAPSLMQENGTSKNNKAERTVLESTWNFPQVADNISLDSSTGDDTIDTDDESFLAASLPDTDLACIDSSSHDSTKAFINRSCRSISSSSTWLSEGLNMCAVMESEAANGCGQGKVESESQATSMTNESSHYHKETITRASATSSSAFENFQADPVTAASKSNNANGKILEEEFDSIIGNSQSSGSSKTECGRGDLDLSVELQMRSSSFCSDVFTSSDRSQSLSFKQAQDSATAFRSSSGISSGSLSIGSESSEDSEKTFGKRLTQMHTSKSFLKKLVSGNAVLLRPRSVTEQSVSTMSIGGKDDYIFQAANQICKAQNSEANGDYEVAFAYYKSGVGILLHGVQGDTNKFRRDAVRRKTAKYLMKAEDLFNRHLSNENIGEPRWGIDNFLSPSLDPSFAFIRGSSKELRNFQVLGTIDRVILVQHKVTDETFVIKPIPKSTLDTGSIQNILPTTCPYMVSLHRIYETENSVFLLLQYASGGKLWTYLGNYLNSDRGSWAKWGIRRDAVQTDCRNIYSGTKPEATDKDEGVKHVYFKLKEISKKEKVTSSRDFDQSSEVNSEKHVESFNSTDASRFSILNKEINELSAMGVIGKRSSQNESFDVESSGDNSSDCQDICTDSNLSHALTLPQNFLDLSDDSAAIGKQDSSVISPLSLPEEDSFHSLLQKMQTDSEAFSVISIDSEDTNHSFSFCEKTSDISANTECSDSSTCVASNQINDCEAFHLTENDELPVINEDQVSIHGDLSPNVARTFAPAFSSDDIIRKSKELLTQVEKVLAETNNRTGESSNKVCEDNSDVKPFSYDSNGSAEERLKCEDKRSYVGRTSYKNSDKHCSISNKCWSPAQNYMSAQEFINTSTKNNNLNAVDLTDSSYSQPGESVSPVLKRVLESENRKHHPYGFTRSSSSLFKQTSTPRKLSVSHMSSKGMSRSASFESDFKSPLRSRARAVSDSFELMDSTDVDPVQIPESLIRKWMAQVVTAVSRLHSLGVVCRDLKPGNILLGDGGQVCLTYFFNLGHGDQELDWTAKQNLYAAPEVGSVNKYDRSCDWWSIGALLYELIVGRSLSECHPGGINSHTCLHIPTFVSSETRGLLEGLLRYNPNERLGSGMAGSEEIKAHPFFAGVDWHSLEYS